jgi:hypothetical protein
VPGFFSYGDLARLGGLRREAMEVPDAWGTSGLSFDGRWRLRFPDAQPLATLTGRMAKGLLATLVPDLALMVAETLTAERLPAILTRAVLSVTTLEYIEHLRLASDDDWLTLISDAQRILPERMVDDLASAVTIGPLVPVTKTN